MEFLIPGPMRALDAIKKIYPQSSRRTLQQWIKGGRFSVDGQPLQKDSEKLVQGQTLRSEVAFRPPLDGPLKILYEDRWLIVIDKPEGLLSVPLDPPLQQESALSILRDASRTDQIFAVHRLDRESSGVLIFAKGTQSVEKLKNLFESHDLNRQYFAIIEGRIPENSGTWDYPILELPNYDVVVATHPEEGRQAITHFEVLRRSAKYSYLRLVLETGRKHQIRVQCKHAGFPILGDKRYGSTENPIKRMALHAENLTLVHPFTQKTLSFTSPIPPAFKKMGIL